MESVGGSAAQCLLLSNSLVDFGDIPSWELDEHRLAAGNGVGRDKRHNTGRPCGAEGHYEVTDFVSSGFPTIGIREVPVRNQNRQFPKN